MIIDVHVLVDATVDGFWLRSGLFEGPATIKIPALPEDTYWIESGFACQSRILWSSDLTSHLRLLLHKGDHLPEPFVPLPMS